jgi:hypothetical protein
MARNRKQSGWNIEDPTDAEVSAAIRYLDSNPGGENDDSSDSATCGIGLPLMILCLEFAVSILLYYHIC